MRNIVDANKIIAKAIGIDHIRYVDEKVSTCSCGNFSVSLPYSVNVDFTKPDDYFKMMKWMREKERCFDFGRWLDSKHGIMIGGFLCLYPQQQVMLIAEWIEK